MIVVNVNVNPTAKMQVQNSLTTLAKSVKPENLKFLEDVCKVTDPNKLIEDLKKQHGHKVKLGKMFKL